MTKELNGRELAGFIKERQSHQVKTLPQKPTLLIIRDSDNPVIVKYVTLKQKYGNDIGINVEDFYAKTPQEIKQKILSANQDPQIHGIILQLPLTNKDNTDELTNLIAPQKDVDGLGQDSLFDSATATAILWLLTGYNINLENTPIAIVGRGKLVGTPLFQILTNSNYQVRLFHRGDNLAELKKYPIIITATGVPNLITSDFISPYSTIVDAGTASENGILKGDVSDDVRSRSDLNAITPTIGGVGPLTVACLFDHVIQAAGNSTK